MKFNPFKKKTEDVQGPLWIPVQVEGHDDIQVLVEPVTFLRVRKGSPGNWVHGKYRVNDSDLADKYSVIEVMDTYVTEFLETRVNKSRENEFFENRAN